MTPERKLKAYAWDNDQDGTTTIEWFDSAGKAKRYFADENELPFTQVRVYRIPWADNYKSMEEIPKEVYLANGWWFECYSCGFHVCEDEAIVVDNKVYCLDCYERMKQNDT